jgi:hypothetical protein
VDDLDGIERHLLRRVRILLSRRRRSVYARGVECCTGGDESSVRDAINLGRRALVSTRSPPLRKSSQAATRLEEQANLLTVVNHSLTPKLGLDSNIVSCKRITPSQETRSPWRGLGPSLPAAVYINRCDVIGFTAGIDRQLSTLLYNSTIRRTVRLLGATLHCKVYFYFYSLGKHFIHVLAKLRWDYE